MRHGKKINHLGRKSQHRKATLMNLANSLIVHKRIKTTVAKAKALRTFVEPLITKSKDDSTHSRRIVFSYLKDKEAVTTLFRDVSAKVADRPGGYTRIIKIGTRYGDNAEMCYIELVDYNENLLGTKKTAKKTTRRSRSKKSTATQPKAEVKETPTDEVAATPEVKDKAAEATVVEEKKETKKVESSKEKDAPKAEVKQEEKPKAEAKQEGPKAKKTPDKKEKPTAEKKEEDSKADKKSKEDKDSEEKSE